MKKIQRNLKIKVLFNASVVLSGINSPKGGSGKLLDFVKKGKINGLISEIILDEILRHSNKFDLTRGEVLDMCQIFFKSIISAPKQKLVHKYSKLVIDEGDAHILASGAEHKIKYLVTLDKKHLLILKGKIKGLNIMSPGELIEFLAPAFSP